MSARKRGTIVSAALVLSTLGVVPAWAFPPTQDSTAPAAAQIPAPTDELPDDVRGTLEDARSLLEEAFDALEAAEPSTARSIGEEAVDLLLPLLLADPVASSESLRSELHSAVRLADRLSEISAFEDARSLARRISTGFERAAVTEYAELFYCKALLAFIDGDVPAAARHLELEVQARERTLPAEHPALLKARQNLAVMVGILGDRARARDLHEAVLAVQERTLPADHPDLLHTRGQLGVTLRFLRELARAREHHEGALAAWERTVAADNPDLLHAREDLAITLKALGDLSRARDLMESVVAAYESMYPAEHPDLRRARANLSTTLSKVGDLPRCRELRENVLAAAERALPSDHLDVLRARGDLAYVLLKLGDYARARELQESVLAACERTLPANHSGLAEARQMLAQTLWQSHEYTRARQLLDGALAIRERTLPANHPEVLSARGDLATTYRNLGDFSRACELEESIFATWEAQLATYPDQVLSARTQLALALHGCGDVPRARAHLPAIVEGYLRLAVDLAALSPREASAIVAARRFSTANVLFLSDFAEANARAGAFALVETQRLMSQALPRAAARVDPEIEVWRAEAALLRERLSDLVSESSRVDRSDALASEVTRLTRERDGVDRRIRSKLAESGVFSEPVLAESLASRLPRDSAAIGYLRYTRRELDAETKRWSQEGSLLAHVLRGNGELQRIELGSARTIEDLVRAWRDSLGKPVGGRGIGIETAASTQEREIELGEALRRAILDPLISSLDEQVSTLHVCLDDMLFLVPLDALPLGEGRVGERYRIVNEVSFARLLHPGEHDASDPSLLVLGGAAFDSDLEADGTPFTDAATPPLLLAERSGGSHFTPLAQTELEVQTLAELFEDVFDVEALLLTKEKANKRALHDHAPGARFLHLATHGWFAPESVASVADAREHDGWERMDLEETVTGFAPMTLCGLALAGANQGRDVLGRVPGILTAEELGALDLSRCELAVLSACETNVGIRRAGQGIQSLQAALHAAGARTAITSLWKVDDAATRRLMELFYTRLWSEKQPKAKALWEAKMALRAGGAPVRDWAGWVLSGDPE